MAELSIKGLRDTFIPKEKQEEIRQLRLAKIKTNFDANVGGSTRARAALSTFDDPNKRLEAVRRFYPGAQRVSDIDPNDIDNKDNFFIEYEPGRWTMFDEPGMSGRDVVDYGKTIGEMTGGVVGGGLGAGLGTLKGVPLGPAGMATLGVLGAGAGSAAGAEVMSKGADTLGDLMTPGERIPRAEGDVMDLGQMGTDMAVSVGMDTIPYGLGQVMKPLAGKIVKGLAGQTGRAKAKEIATMAEGHKDIEIPSYGILTGNPRVIRLEKNINNLPFSGSPLNDSIDNFTDSVIFAQQELGNKVAPRAKKLAEEWGNAPFMSADEWDNIDTWAKSGKTADIEKLQTKILKMGPDRQELLKDDIIKGLSQDWAGQPSVSSFTDNWKQYNRAAKLAIFGKENTDSIDSFVKVLNHLETSPEVITRSTLPKRLMSELLFSPFTPGMGGGLLGGLIFGGSQGLVGGAMIGAGASVGAGFSSRSLLRMLTDEDSVKWLAETAKMPWGKLEPNRIRSQIAKLAVIADRNPEMSGTINNYIDSLVGNLNAINEAAGAEALSDVEKESVMESLSRVPQEDYQKATRLPPLDIEASMGGLGVSP